ncbi:hypothetical protein ABZP36_008154 [Zizania latifolia]
MEDIWIMDSGCSRHMTGHHRWFSSLTPTSSKDYITFGDNGQGKVLGVGSIRISSHFSLRNVALVDKLGFNLISFSQLLEEGLEVRFKKGCSCVVDSRGVLICQILPFGWVFRIDFSSTFGPSRYLMAGTSSELSKWHRRLGHLSFDLLVKLSSLGLIRGLPKLKMEKDLVCYPCRHGKMVADSHAPVTQVMTEYPGELLHMETVGPARVRSVDGKWYVLVIVDDYSRFLWVFFLESKDEVFQYVHDLILRLKNERNGRMRGIHSDNGSEFKNSQFDPFCSDQGLEHQFSAPYTPPQNGFVERKNRTLVKMARTMLDEHRTPRRFWAEAINTACYIANHIFLRAYIGKTSYELQFGRQPKVSHLRAFGCKCFVLKKGKHLDKFESCCHDGVFLGYALHSHGFRVWNLDTEQLVETCEVFFDESIPCTTPIFESTGDDELGEPIFEDEQEAPADDGGKEADPAASETSTEVEEGPLTTTSTTLLPPPLSPELPVADDEVTFERHGS